ncbi:bifunctional adenosylcobinamide kinase/adenosylcobinamide-phosphate guanylyltransferase [Jannaschia aquimarina]|uniref:Bifunctional adenosylcobalamin biosynthesis protein n=1 Tax=Jannaschia aquimarina TaxID=935700 RepID=A0A0D1ECF3_9RHOB|nr:bifunctional adenosylcobinamide kinase/adenosylcobinamide-phosphate guanylyltransferase [Jannaschia aquimarina]KIT14606.1 Bifunctional adenosylcobalamin biosynthesis protein CobP [Jannaschia aquimarina]SNS77359.1 adenosylcobinamide kinase /adenosylcobinamide-phosphate guanylyltransferase [Jannaschia aquimarina]
MTAEACKILLVLGHAASGKSAWAEARVVDADAPTYLATSRVLDDEMRRKVEAHAARRGPGWTLVEEPVNLAAACDGLTGTVLVDCVTMWLTNLLMDDADWRAPLDAWISAMHASSARFVLVSNDVGGGVTPDNGMARRFQHMQGLTNQRLAAEADRVVLVTAGLPQVLK